MKCYISLVDSTGKRYMITTSVEGVRRTRWGSHENCNHGPYLFVLFTRFSPVHGDNGIGVIR